MIEGLSPEEIHHAVDRVVDEVLGEAGVAGPPVDAVALALARLGPDPGAGRRGKKAAAEDLSPEQRQWLAAQRLGEHCKPRLLRRLGVAPEEARGLGGPSLVSLFATHLLLPTGWFSADARSLCGEVPELARRYRTAGVGRVAVRLLDLPEPCVITVVDNEHVTQRRSNAWRVRRELEPAEQECQRYVHHYSRPRVVRGGGWTVWGWPFHQSDWKREVLRSVGEGDGGA
jgi:hypothetical protein